ncbi:hypothetical protein CYY_003674 [Polysphondylium violaceum]|uniref:Vacuolar protein sorting 55 family protein n=1 Tax=Polysphondylium violaceum TaxID=133409 RepID=A0A8J4PWG3_9MYCE|nr:hypothetical protein CYY_003674 [Polysphondylium violaceum]
MGNHTIKGMLGLLLNILACIVSHSGYPIIVVVTYFLAPFPNLICRSRDSFSSEKGAVQDIGLFLTGFLIASGFGVPAVLAHSEIISYKALAFSIAGGVTVYATIIGFLAFFNRESDDEW